MGVGCALSGLINNWNARLFEVDVPDYETKLYGMDGTEASVARIKVSAGFFGPGSSSNRYLAICYHNIPNKTIVWVANRDNPLNDPLGVLMIGNKGKLVLVERAEIVLCLSNHMNTSLQSRVAQLLDSGNLVLKDSSKYISGNYIWQSFDHLSDTLLAGMKFGWDLRMGLDRHMTSRKSTKDPSTKDFTYGVNLRGIIPQFIVHKGHAKYYRTGPWNRIQFSGVQMTPNLIFTPKFVNNSQLVYYTFKAFNESTITRLELNSYGNIQRYLWNEKIQ
ncbi:S-locus-specific glycoprotein S6-like [Eucalyptus grandis]|uniref:S-locus-specific glycoprotein S6-like n=1 Tax=Eucalyptus grandis TaxID=71139 RepID=UPI00192EB13E|nr:S-locus-specific glycoprotein S6-like [Eucalyptus grandis]